MFVDLFGCWLYSPGQLKATHRSMSRRDRGENRRESRTRYTVNELIDGEWTHELESTN